jgi:hypothetical protein
MIQRVFKDRTNNEDAAWGLRLANLNAEEDSDDNSMVGTSKAEDEGATADGEKDMRILFRRGFPSFEMQLFNYREF